MQEEPDNHFPDDDTDYSKKHFTKLRGYVEDEYNAIYKSRVESIANGSELHAFVNDEMDNEHNPFHWLRPSKIVDLFRNGDEQSQIEVINSISKIRSSNSPEFSEWADWADELDKLISELDFNNPLFRHRCFTLKSILRS